MVTTALAVGLARMSMPVVCTWSKKAKRRSGATPLVASATAREPLELLRSPFTHVLQRMWHLYSNEPI